MGPRAKRSGGERAGSCHLGLPVGPRQSPSGLGEGDCVGGWEHRAKGPQWGQRRRRGLEQLPGGAPALSSASVCLGVVD